MRKHDPQSKLPSSFSLTEKAQAMAILDETANLTNPYDGAWEAEWLLCGFNDSEWIISKGNKTYKINNKWHNAFKINWTTILPDGSYLTDKKNNNLLVCTKKLVFLLYELPQFRIQTTNGLKGTINTILLIIRWLVLNNDKYDAYNKGLYNLDKYASKEIIIKYISGGCAWVLDTPIRLLIILNENCHGLSIDNIITKQYTSSNYDITRYIYNKEVFGLSDKQCSIITDWLRNNNYFVISKSGGRNILKLSIAKIAELVNVPQKYLSTNKMFLSFIRQFEPELNKNILQRSFSTEHPSHTTPLVSDIINSSTKSKSCTDILQTLKMVLRLKNHIPDIIPDTTNFKIGELSRLIDMYTKYSEHTPWVPIKIALKQTTEAIRWIHVYGEPLICFYIECLLHFRNVEYSGTTNKSRRLRNEYIRDNIPRELFSLNITNWSWRSKHEEFDWNRFRESPTLVGAMKIFYGAVFTIISLTKPIRINEIIELESDCILLKKDDGYWLKQTLGKSNIYDERLVEARPIPTITAKALELAKRIGDTLKEYDTSLRDDQVSRLFVIHDSSSSTRLKGTSLSPTSLQHRLDIFSDYISIPLDSHGRRWYLNIHEGRKSFLIVFFWCFKYSSLEAARWIAGHSDIEHVYAYIQANFPGEELNGIEAEYASKALLDYEHTNNKGEARNIEELYDSVCQQFKVNKLCVINESELRDWLKLAFTKGVYKIEPYTIASDTGSIDNEIAFRITKTDQNGS